MASCAETFDRAPSHIVFPFFSPVPTRGSRWTPTSARRDLHRVPSLCRTAPLEKWGGVSSLPVHRSLSQSLLSMSPRSLVSHASDRPTSRGLLPVGLAAVALSAVVLVVGAALVGAPAMAHAAAGGIVATAATTTHTAAALLGQSHRWWEALTETGFYQAFSLVFVSEIGDKTFFIAGLLAMKTSRLISFVGSLGALAAMTLVSVIIGQIFHAVPAGIADGIPLDDIAAVAAFAFFGIKTLKEALEMNEGSSTMDDELAEAEEAVEKPGLFGTPSSGNNGTATGTTATPWGQIASIFALVFAAEFGDRSFLSTIALSAAQNPASVAVGAIAAHAAATGIAVGGGAYLSKYISERVIGLIGGTLFLVFAVTTALGIF